MVKHKDINERSCKVLFKTLKKCEHSWEIFYQNKVHFQISIKVFSVNTSFPYHIILLFILSVKKDKKELCALTFLFNKCEESKIIIIK